MNTKIATCFTCLLNLYELNDYFSDYNRFKYTCHHKYNIQMSSAVLLIKKKFHHCEADLLLGLGNSAKSYSLHQNFLKAMGNIFFVCNRHLVKMFPVWCPTFMDILFFFSSFYDTRVTNKQIVNRLLNKFRTKRIDISMTFT